jgi:serine/threonine-protein kinase
MTTGENNATSKLGLADRAAEATAEASGEAIVPPPIDGAAPMQLDAVAPVPVIDASPPEDAPPPGDAPPPPPPPRKSESMRPGGPDSLIGLVISDRYRIEKLLGEGGMGAVYQAEHTLMRKRLAVKVLHPEMSRMREVVARFEREAMAAAHIEHPNVAAATDFGKLEDGSFFLVLEFIEGKALRAEIGKGRLALGRALHITQQILAALVRAHALGIVHRDLKPENVMLVDRDGDHDFVKVLDFGIAKVPIHEIGEGEGGKRDPNTPALTQAGMVYGTPEYMAPEQALGNPVDPRADLYAVGVMAYEMLTGVRPFEADSKVKLLGMQVTAPVPAMIEKAVDAVIPFEVEELVRKLLSKEAVDRGKDAKEVLDNLTAVIAALVAEGHLEEQVLGNAGPQSAQIQVNGRPPRRPSGAAFAVAPTAAQQALPASTRGPATLIEQISARVRRDPKIVAFAGGGAFVFLVVVAIGISALKAHGATPNGLDEAGVALNASASASASASAAPPLDSSVHEGIALVDKGDYASGIAKLTTVPDDAAKRPEVRRALATAYAATDKYEDCMTVVAAWLKEDPPVANDQKVRIMIRDSAISEDAIAADLAFGLLEKHMGTIGLDDLYDIAYGASGQYNAKARNRARTILKKPDVKGRMTSALKVTYDIASIGQSCKVKDYFERAQTDGDMRTVAALKPLANRVPSGWFGKDDALRCIHEGSLTKTIAAIETRLK